MSVCDFQDTGSRIFQKSDIFSQRQLWETIFENIIEIFRKLIVFEKFGKKR